MKLNMYADFTFKISFEDRLTLIKENGFNGVMLGFSQGLKYTQYETADKCGLEIENVHSPFDSMNALWEPRHETDYILNRTLETIKLCSENGVKTVIVHPTDGLNAPDISKYGLFNFDKLVNYAEEKNVVLAFENIQLPKYLDVIFEKFGQSDKVKFCYDVGHENCFSIGSNCLEKFGDKLCATHIHDNDSLNDGHLIPFDGNIDYSDFINSLRQLDWNGALSFEVYMNKSPLYDNITPADFVEKTFKSAKKLEKMYLR